MAVELLGADCLSEEYKYSWYISRREIENYSPSRKDGIDLRKESELRMLYCLFLKDFGMKLQVPQGTIATAMLFCHRFYLHQSHAKNDWQTIATACMLLACKVEETFCSLDKVVVVAYRTIYKKDPDAARKIYQKVDFEKQKALILIAERLLLSTIRFDFNVQHPYKPLLDAFKKFGITRKEVRQFAWNFVNDSLQTTLCLQYKPHYIAAGAIFLAAKMHNVKLPSERGYVWWNEFDVTPKLLNVATHEMAEILGFRRRPAMTETIKKPMPTPLAAKDDASSPESCVLSQPGSDFTGAAIVSKPVDRVDCGSTNNMNSNPDIEKACPNSREERQSQGRAPESLKGVVEDCRGSGKVQDQLRPNPKRVDSRLRTVDTERIKGMMRMKRERETSCQTEAIEVSCEDAWIERELESGIEFVAESNKRRRP